MGFFDSAKAWIGGLVKKLNDEHEGERGEPGIDWPEPRSDPAVEPVEPWAKIANRDKERKGWPGWEGERPDR